MSFPFLIFNNKKITSLIYIILFSLSFLKQAHAFKVDNHILIGQEVLNNLNKCQFSAGKPCVNMIKSEFKNLPINSEIAEALNKYPEYYRMGNSGPDVFPDIVSGQTAIHPGVRTTKGNKIVKSGFATGEWLDLLIKKALSLNDKNARLKALAFSYGYAGHISGDVFAHTYINRFAGDIFDFANGEAEAERRHMAVENYMAQNYPNKVLGKNHQPIKVWEVVKNTDGTWSIPHDFLIDTLILSEESSNEFSKTLALHFPAVQKLYKEINKQLCSNNYEINLKKNVEKVADDYLKTDPDSEAVKSSTVADTIAFIKSINNSSSGCLLQDNEIAVIQIIAKYKFKLNLDKHEAGKLSELANEIGRLLQRGEKEIAAGKKRVYENLKQLTKSKNKVVLKIADSMFSRVNDFFELNDQLLNLQLEISKAETQILETQTKLANEFNSFACEAINWTCPDSDFLTQVNETISKTCTGLRKVLKTRQIVEKGFCPVKRPDVCYRKVGFVKVPYPCLKDVNEVCDVIKNITEQVDETFQYPCSEVVTRTVVDLHKKLLCTQAQLACMSLKKGWEMQKNGLEDFVSKKQSLFSSLKVASNYAQRKMPALKQFLADRINDINGLEITLIDTAEKFDLGVSEAIYRSLLGVRSILEGWRGDIRVALAAYLDSNASSIINTFDNDSSTHGGLKAFSEWKTCYLPRIIGIPGFIHDSTICQYTNILQQIEKIKMTIRDSLLKMAPKEIQDIYSEVVSFIDNKIPRMAAKAVDEAFSNLFNGKNINLENYFLATRKDIDASELDRIIAKPINVLNVPGIPHASGKVTADIGTVISNSINLASLALVDADGLNLMLQSKNISPLYNNLKNHNILTHSIASIDGNHQWQPLAPKYFRLDPRNNTLSDEEWLISKTDTFAMNRRFSMQEWQGSEYGFKLFTNEVARKEIFNKIFQRPFTPDVSEVLFGGSFDDTFTGLDAIISTPHRESDSDIITAAEPAMDITAETESIGFNSEIEITAEEVSKLLSIAWNKKSGSKIDDKALNILVSKFAYKMKNFINKNPDASASEITSAMNFFASQLINEELQKLAIIPIIITLLAY
ncbi:MAG: zinc dependent phospholipase C family protein [Oligoflexia bacterium]|nr:zinc dependent phospholipase C family protein [Oligoflexia bacterium]